MKRKPPRKYIPPSGLVQVTPDEVLSRTRIDPLVEGYPKVKGDIEAKIAEKWVAGLKKSGYCRRGGDFPDIIYIEETPQGDIVTPIEVTELVNDRDRRLRPISDRYTKLLQQVSGLESLYLSFYCEEECEIPAPSDSEGSVLQEIKEAILGSATGKSPDTGALYLGSVGSYQTGNYLNCKLKGKNNGRYVQMFFSIDGIPVGIHTGPKEEDWARWGEELERKFNRDYAPKENPDFKKSELNDPVLLLHVSHAQPDFSRLSDMIKKLQSEHGNPFAEVWYIKLYPAGLDSIRQILPIHRMS